MGMGMFNRSVAAALALTLAACAQTPPHSDAPESAVRASGATHSKVDYQRFVQGSATWFDFRHLSDWDSPDPSHVVVWTTPNQAYLLTLFGACFSLADAPTIMLSTRGMVTAGNDAVIVQGERCPIQRIDRLDGRRLKAALAQ